MSTLLSQIIRGCTARERWKFFRSVRDPAKTQKQFLLRLLHKNRDTLYGTSHHFSTIFNEEDFRRNLPIVQYTDIEAHIERIKAGVENVLTQEPVFMFSMTSGTTSRPKYIPITRSGQRRSSTLMLHWLHRALLDHPTLMNKGFLTVTGVAEEGRCSGKVPYGSASGMINMALPSFLKRCFAVEPAIARVSDYDLRYYLLARLAYEQAVSFIATPSPLTLVKLAQTAIGRQDEIIRSIHDGCLSDSLKTSWQREKAKVPEKLCRILKQNRGRAVFLEQLIEKNGQLLPKDCWPELTMIGCWLGGGIGYHTGAMEKYFGEVPRRDLGYMASEGCFALPFEDGTPAGILALHNNYYEFIPESQLDRARPDILRPTELEAGKCYKIIISNENGLYRYDINDIVKVEGWYQQTPIISFLRKSGHFMNMAGEKLHLNHCLEAIKTINDLLSLNIAEFRACPDPEKLRYEFFIDFRSGPPDQASGPALLTALDAALCENNIEYDSKRKSKRLNPPCIHVMDASWVETIRRKHAGFHLRDVQYKWLQVSPEKIPADALHIISTLEFESPC